MKLYRALLALAVLVAAPAASSVSLDLDAHQDSHGVAHVEPDSAGHRHGDSDDHHETPDSPCHHHEIQCCCALSHALYPHAVALGVDPGLTRRIAWDIMTAVVDPTAKSLFHVPIA